MNNPAKNLVVFSAQEKISFLKLFHEIIEDIQIQDYHIEFFDDEKNYVGVLVKTIKGFSLYIYDIQTNERLGTLLSKSIMDIYTQYLSFSPINKKYKDEELLDIPDDLDNN